MSEILANNPAIKTWIEVPENSDFPIQNLPFGIFKTDSLSPRVGSRIGNSIIDLKTLYALGYLSNLPFSEEDFDTNYLNPMMQKGKLATRNLRNRLSKLFSTDNNDLRNNSHHVDQIIVAAENAQMLLPVQIG
ncbi:MAG TPA: fumarylacetoacetase, partial [Taishania sp.]|nr:fumarylacetoacetase [Taishania sp.]